MKNILITSSLLFLNAIAFSQTSSSLNISGQAQLSMQPEIVLVTYDIVAKDDAYETALYTMTQRIDRLTATLISIGFKKEEIQTSNFNIRKNRKYNQGKDQGEEVVASRHKNKS